MKKLISFIVLLLALWFFTLRADAPPTPVFLPIIEAEALHPYGITDHTLLAFIWLESRFKENAVNKISKARGILQITPVMIREVNKICRKYLSKGWVYTWKDAFDPVKSIEIWCIIQKYKNPTGDVQKACRIWFDTGKQYDGKTWKWYYKVISNHLKI